MGCGGGSIRSLIWLKNCNKTAKVRRASTKNCLGALSMFPLLLPRPTEMSGELAGESD